MAWSRVWDYDVWFQLACGRAIAELGRLPVHDVLSWTATDRPWDTQEWLSQVLGYGIWRAGGLPALTAVKALLAGALVWLIWRRAVASTAGFQPDGEIRLTSALPWLAAGLCGWGAYVMRWHLVERPQILTYGFVALELIILESGRSPWILVPVTVLWANLHGGSALLGPGLFALWTLGAAAAGWRQRRHAGVMRAALLPGVALLAAVMANPAGWRLYLYPWETMSDRMYMANVVEWLSPTLQDQPEFFVWLVAAAGLIAATARRHGVPALLTGVTLAGLSLLSRRHIPLAVIALTPPAARALAALVPAPGRIAAAAAAAACAGSVGWAAWHGEALRTGIRQDLYPAGALGFLRNAPLRPGRDIRTFTLHRWGGYLEWFLPGRFRTFIDGRQLVFGRELFADYYRILENTPEAPLLLRLLPSDLFVLGYGAKVGPRLAADPTLALVHWDDTCLVYVRRAAADAGWLKEHRYAAFHPETGPGGSVTAALVELDRAARETPSAARPWTSKTRLLLSLGRTADAGLSAREAVARAPGILPVLLTAFDAAIARRDTAGAGALLRDARRLDPRGPAPRVAAARLALLAGDPAGADRMIADAIRAGEKIEAAGRPPGPALADAFRLLADRRHAAGDRAGASDALRRAGNADYRAGLPADAIVCYRHALALTPSDPRLLHNLGAVLVAQGRPADALVVLRQAHALDPRNADTLTAIGLAHYRLGDVGAARAAWKQAIALVPGHADAASYLKTIGE